MFLSHDWPRGIAKHGDANALMRKKKFLADEIKDNTLGSPPAVWPAGQASPRHETHCEPSFLEFDGML